MSSFLKISFFLILAGLGFRSGAQIVNSPKAKEYFRATHWDIEDGLSQSEVYFIYKDSRNFLWVSTMNGLNRFDGVLFKNYYHDYKDSSSLPGKRINSIVEDSLHNIWIGTNKGMSRYDYKNDRFSNFYRSLSDSGIHDQIVPFWSTPDKVLCFEGNSHITSYDVRTFRKTKLVAITDTGHIIGMGASDQYPVYDLKTQKVWFILGNRFLPGGGLRCVDITNGKTKDYGWECTRHIKNHCHDAEAMRYDSRRNSIWLNTNDGLVEFSLDELRFHPVKAFAKWTAFSDYTRFCGISIDTSGRIWVATFPKGIFIYDPRNGMLTRPFENDSVLQKEVSYWNAVLYCDNQGITWSGGWLRKGFYQITPFSQAIRRYTADPLKPHSLNTNSVKSFIKGPGGKLWMGTNRGINIFDPHSDEFSQLKLENVMGLGNNIIPTWIDTVNRYAILFTAPPVGIYRMNLDTRKISTVHFVNTEGIPLSNVEPRPPRHYKRGSILAADLPDRQSVFFLDEQHDTANEILHFAPGTIDESRPLVENNEWLFLRRPEAPTNLSYREINGRWTLSPTALDSVPWSIIIYNERDNSYWAGGNGFLLHYDRSFKLMDRFSSEKELSHLDILGLILDAHHNIWFVTDRSIGKLDPRTRVIKILNAQNDGFIRQDFDPIFFPCKDDEGDLYIPGGVIFGVGFDRIKPDALTETYPPSTIYLRNLRVNQKDFKLTTGLNEIPELNLDYSENRIALETGAIDYYSKGAGKIRYKLEGLKEDWKYAPSNYTIRYDLLPHGKYKLLMQAGNAADEFTGPVKSITLNIEPAIWNSLRFRLGAGILLLITGWLLIRYRIQNKFRKTLENSEQERRIASMALRTAELQQQTTELEMKALRAQMNPHFIFNSLNSINRFILQNNKSLASEYLTKFSKLVRLILQNSQASLISLESELEALKLYLDLEALRFDYRFDHKISIPSELDISSLKIPPLIIQPYAENAIWHGLMHKEEKGKLDIEFSQEKNSLFIRIADDGVGREMARAFSSKSATRYKPMGLQITAERISKLQDGPGQSGDIRINDLVTPEGTPAGTEVIIQIPLIYD